MSKREQELTQPKLQTGVRSGDQLTVALAGQPNVGKSTLFNLLTGLNQHVGNWPGKTIEKKVGTYRLNDRFIRIVDLPGTYSLTANSIEERIARDYIIKEHPDVVIAIVNAANLERNLYLVAELICLPVPVVLGLNMIDVAEQQGMRIEPHVLEAALGLPVVPLVASRNQGVRELMAVVEKMTHGSHTYRASRPQIREDHRLVLSELSSLLKGQVPDPYLEDWIALKLLEGDEEITKMMQVRMPPQLWEQVHTILMQHEDAILGVAGGRYDWIRRMVRAALIHPSAGSITLTDWLDRFATHPLFGLVLLFGVFGVTFWLTFSLATPVQTWLEDVVVTGIAEGIRDALQNAPQWLSSLLVDGLVAGVGTVLTFLPVLVVFFTLLGLLEDVGYLTRGAYVLDRFMHPLGLHGKSCLALCIGFGCNVPAVLAGRMVETERGRLLTILLTPLVPCAGRLMVLAFLTPIFFGPNAALVSWGLLTLNLLALVVIGVLLNRLIFGGERMAFIMELPLYHIPNLRTIALFVWHRSKVFLSTAGSIILFVSVVVWALARFPGPGIENSILSNVGRWLSPLAAQMGLDWRMMVALLSSFLAKENTIATLGVLFRAGQGGTGLEQVLAGSLTPAAAMAFLAVQMLFVPCAATVAVMRQEMSSWRWTLFSVVLLFVVSFGVGVAIYQGLTLLDL
ncbi:MAG: ferrous iron transport protein B [Anaerolineales bacterium]|jgi:ferrous iron transport protein B